MPFIDDNISNSLLGLVGTGRAAYGLQLIKDVNNGLKHMDEWTSRAHEAGRNRKPFLSDSGKMLKMSPEEADRLVSIYTEGARKAAQMPLGGVPAGELVGKARMLSPMMSLKLMSLTGNKDAGRIAELTGQQAGWRQHYAMFSNSKGPLNELNNHMLMKTFLQDRTDLDQKAMNEARAAFDNLNGSAKAVMENHDLSIANKFKALKRQGDKAGLNFLEKYIVGLEGDLGPSAVEYINGGITGNPKNPVARAGLADAYKTGTKLPARALKYVGAANLGIGGSMAGWSLYRMLKPFFGGGMFKESAAKQPNDEDMYRAAQLSLSGMTTGAGGLTEYEAIKKLLAAMKKKDKYNVGFTYVKHPGTGNGHAAPAANIRKILERGMEDLPADHPLKGKVNMYDVPNLVEGMGADIMRDYDVMYNTGLGAIPGGGEVAPSAHNEHDIARKNAMNMAGKVKFLKNYQTDTMPSYPVGFGKLSVDVGVPINAAIQPSANAEMARNNVERQLNHLRNLFPTADVETMAYGRIPTITKLVHNLTPVLPGTLVNYMPDGVGTPFINQDILASFDKNSTREDLLKELEEAAGKMKTGGDMTPERLSDVQGKIKRIVEDARNGNKIVSIAGSGRGDYVINRAAHLLDSADRLGLKGVTAVPLFAGYGGMDLTQDEVSHIIKKIEGADKRIVGMGNLPGDVYNLLQRISDANMVSTGQMAVSEAANSGNLQYIPRSWNDSGEVTSKSWVKNVIHDLLGDKRPDLTVKALESKLPEVNLDVWNRGTLQTFADDLPSVFKRMESYDGTLRPGVVEKLKSYGLSDNTIGSINQKFDTDPLVNLLKDNDQLANAKKLAMEGAANNRLKVHDAQKMLFDRFTDTLKDSTSFKANLPARLPGLLGGLGMLGLGGYGVYDAISSPITKLHQLRNLV